MDITCEQKALYHVPAQDIVMDESIAINTTHHALSDDKKDPELSDLEITMYTTHVHSTTCEQTLLHDKAEPKHDTKGRSSCLWSKISTDFDPDEETVNFGTRYALETDGKLFDVFTYATIEPKVNNFHSILKWVILLKYIPI